MNRAMTALMLAGLTLYALHAQSVRLAWDASSSPTVVGYRIYLGTNAGVFSYVTNVGLVQTQTVQLPHSGRWYFTATAVDQAGVESQPSNQVQTESKPVAPLIHGETFVRLTPIIERSTDLVNWQPSEGAATWIPATNKAEYFTTRRLLIERVQRAVEP